MNLVFLDCETTGLSPRDSRLLEVGCVAVELPTFEIIDECNWVFHYDIAHKPHGFIHQKVVEMHHANGLWKDCFRSQLNDYQKMDLLVSQWVVDHGGQGMALAGANPGFDRKFLESVLPTTDKTFHYRAFDTNTLWLLREYLTGERGQKAKPATHRAVDDCKDAIATIEQFFNFFEKLVAA